MEIIKRIGSGLLIFIIVLLVVTTMLGVYLHNSNPSKEDFAEYMKNEEHVEIQISEYHKITRNDYFIFSVFEFDEVSEYEKYVGVNRNITPK